MAFPLLAVGTLALGAGQAIGGIIKRNKARREIENFQFQELSNKYEGLTPSTLGAELASRESARSASTAITNLREAGSRALIGGLGRTLAQDNATQQRIAANLDAQQKNIDMAIARDDAAIRQMNEQRQRSELAGIGSMYGMAQQQANVGTANLMNAGSMLQDFNWDSFDWGFLGGNNDTTQKSSVSGLNVGDLSSGFDPGTPGGMSTGYRPGLGLKTNFDITFNQ